MYLDIPLRRHNFCEFVFKTLQVRPKYPAETTKFYRLSEVTEWPKFPKTNLCFVFLTSLLKTKKEFVFRFSFANLKTKIEKGIPFSFASLKTKNEKGIRYPFFVRKFENEKGKNGIYTGHSRSKTQTKLCLISQALLMNTPEIACSLVILSVLNICVLCDISD